MKRMFTDEQIQLITEMIDWGEFTHDKFSIEFQINDEMVLMFYMYHASCRIELWQWQGEYVEESDWVTTHTICVVFTGDFEDDMCNGVWKLLESVEED